MSKTRGLRLTSSMRATLAWLYNEGDELLPEDRTLTPYTRRTIQALRRRRLVIRIRPHSFLSWALTGDGYEAAAECSERMAQAREAMFNG